MLRKRAWQGQREKSAEAYYKSAAQGIPTHKAVQSLFIKIDNPYGGSQHMVHSSAFGPFDPMNPKTIRGLFAKNIYADPIEIHAPLPSVWKIMTDFERYPEWNPLNRFFRLDSKAEPNHFVTFGPSWGPYDLTEGAPLPDPHITQHEMITVWEDNCCLAYAVIRSLFKAERVQYISSLEEGKTRYHTYERMSGPLSPLVQRKFGTRIIAGFAANGLALKNRSESL